MLFNSFDFFIFFIVVYGLYLKLSHRPQNFLLLAASLIFYGYWDWRYLGLLGFTIGVDYFLGRKIYEAERIVSKKRFLFLSILSNLSILGFFKYFNFFSDSFSSLAGTFGWTVDPITLRVLLPVGISFYTFQSMSYTIDIYRGQLKPARTLVDFALYVAFFPQLVAGPIERATHLLPQVENPRSVTTEKIFEGIWLFAWGLYKKIFIADNLATIVDAVFLKTGVFSGAEILLATYAFAFQIYGDFSGYSDMARGLAKLMGFDLMINFRFPYFVTNPRDFWLNWHISLSTWLRDYLYIPLGGNRHGSLSMYRNLFLTMFLGGLWHGASWIFVLWGVYQGVLLIAHRLMPPLKSKSRVAQVIKIVFMFHLITLGWLIFRSPSLTHLGNYLSNLFFHFTVRSGQGLGIVFPIAQTIWFLLLLQAVKYFRDDMLAPLKLSTPWRAAIYLTLFYSMVWYGSIGGKEFIYFQF